MTRLWRCVPRKYVKEAYDGRGGLLVDGRWHNAGQPIVYASGSPGTAVLETLVHLGDLQALLSTHVLIGADIPNGLVKDAEGIPSDWNTLPFSESTQVYGDEWLRGRASVALRVPSAVVPDDNILLNPGHEGFKAITIDASPIHWDPRLVK